MSKDTCSWCDGPLRSYLDKHGNKWKRWFCSSSCAASWFARETLLGPAYYTRTVKDWRYVEWLDE